MQLISNHSSQTDAWEFFFTNAMYIQSLQTKLWGNENSTALW